MFHFSSTASHSVGHLIGIPNLTHFFWTLSPIHTLQLNFLFSDWLFSKYAECIENVHCTPRTAPRLLEVLLVRDPPLARPID